MMPEVTALVRRPSPRLAEGLVTHIERQTVDVALAMRQWQGYVNALLSHGWDVIEVPAIDHCPDSVFIEDTAVVRGDIALISRPGAPSRSDEVHGTRRILSGLNYTIIETPEDATLDGGDVLKLGDTIFVGSGGRSNAAGAEALRTAFGPQGVSVIEVPVRKVLHLKSGATALPDGTVVAYAPLFDDVAHFDRVLAVPEESGAHVVVLSDESILMASDAPESAALFRERGLEVVTVDMSEFEKIEGCVTCLSIRLRDLPPQD